jgi:gas vesicle protein
MTTDETTENTNVKDSQVSPSNDENRHNEYNQQTTQNQQSQQDQQSEGDQQSKGSRQSEQKSDRTNYSINRALVGGVLGAGIGLLMNPKASKKVFKNLGESEFVKVAGEEFKKTAQELLAGEAQNSIRSLAEGAISKLDSGLFTTKKLNSQNDSSSGLNQAQQHQSEEYEKIKEDNKNVNERLDRIESMLNDLVSTK